MSCVLGIDLGTSYFKAALFDQTGALRGLSRLPVPKRTEGGCCELAIEDFWRVIGECISGACAEARIAPEEIVAVSYASQANSFLLLDEQNHPLTPLILWPDLRAAEERGRAQTLWEHPRFLSVTGLGIGSPEFMVHKLCWFQEHEPALWASTRHVLTLADYFAFGLTGLFQGDQGTAALLGLWDIQRQEWWDEALRAIDLPARYLGQPLPPGHALGAISTVTAQAFGLRPGVPVIAGSLDHHVAAMGAGLGSIAPATDSTGTVIALLRDCPVWEPRPGCCMGPAAGKVGYYQLTFSNHGAGILEAYQQRHAPEATLPSLLKMAESGEPPHGPPIRAILEDAAEEVASLVRQLYGTHPPARIVATGGGARSDLWLQLKADHVGAEFVVTQCQEPACLGAALLAAVAVGWFPDLSAASAAWVHARKAYAPSAIPQNKQTPLRKAAANRAMSS